MTKKFSSKSITTIVALVAIAAVSGSAQLDQKTAAEFWKNPGFVDLFMGTYGFNTEVEPRITAQEQELFKNLVDLIQSNPTAAASKLKSSITADSSAALDFTLGNLYVQLGELNDAAQNYKTTLKKFPNFRRAFLNLGIVYVQQGKFPAAIENLSRALELGAEGSNIYGLIGYCYLSEEKYLSAESAYRKAIMLAPDNTDWKLGLVRCLLSQAKSKEAVALLDELIQKEPDKVDYWLFQANAYLELGEITKAADNYEIVRRMGKGTGPSLMQLGDIYMSQDYRELALGAYLEALDKAPEQDIKRPLRAAELMVGRQAWEQVSTFLKQIRNKYKTTMTDADGLKILKMEAKIALAIGDSKEAVKTLEQIIDRDPLDGEAILILASHYGRSGEPERADLLFQRAENLRDHEVAALTQHAQFLVTQAKYDKAAKLLQRAQAIRPRDNVARYLEQVERLARAAGP